MQEEKKDSAYEDSAVKVNVKERQVENPLEATESEKIGLCGIEEDMIFPEGGLGPWLVVFGSWCGMTATFGISNAMGAIQFELSRGPLKTYSESEISWIFSIWQWFCLVGGAQVGPIFDTYGSRVLILPAAVLCTASLMIMSVCTEYYQFILGFSVLGGVSSSMIFTPCITAVGHYFKRRRALATGLAASGGAVGGIMFPLVINSLVGRVGYAWTIRVVGFIVMALLIICVITVTDRHSEHEPSKKGAMIDFSSLKETRFLFTVIGTFLCEWAIFVPANYLKIYATRNGMNEDFGTILLVLFGIGSFLGRSGSGYAADKVGAFNTMVFTAGMSGVVSLAIWLPAGTTKGGLATFATLFGLFSGSTISLTPVCVSRISLTKEYGKRYGTCYTIVSFASLTGLPLSGALEGHNFLGMVLFCGFSYLLSAGAFIIARCINNASMARF